MTALTADLTARLLGDAAVAGLISDDARIAAMLRIEAALAEAQAAVGLVPPAAAEAIAAAAAALSIAPSDLAAAMARDGVPVPALVRGLKAALPEAHRDFVHHGATSQDIVDSAMVLTSRDALSVIAGRLVRIVDNLLTLAERHAADPIAGRTRHQLATPTTFGLKVAGWAAPLVRHLQRLEEAIPRFAVVSLSGSSGNLAMMGAAGPEVEARLADALGLGVAPAPWHAARDGVAEIGAVLALVAGSLGRIGADILALAGGEAGEIRPGDAGGSSTMPHKANPIAAEMLVVLARVAADRARMLFEAAIAAGERDGTAWTLEWVALPDLLIATGAAAARAEALLSGLTIETGTMAARVYAPPGLLHSEAAVFALAGTMSKAEAERVVGLAAERSIADGRHLADVLAEILPEQIDWDRLRRLDDLIALSAARTRRITSDLRSDLERLATSQ